MFLHLFCLMLFVVTQKQFDSHLFQKLNPCNWILVAFLPFCPTSVTVKNLSYFRFCTDALLDGLVMDLGTELSMCPDVVWKKLVGVVCGTLKGRCDRF